MDFQAMYYKVDRIDGDYAYLIRTDEEIDEPKLVARALLPDDIKEGSSLKSRNGSKKKYSLKKAGGRGAAKYSGRISGRKSADDFGGIAKGRAQEPEEKETVHGGRTRLRRKKDRGRMDSTGRVLHGRRRQGRKTKRRN